ncbi:hypothetical protein KOSB73_300068 [Klebsiella grimontii]|uniref:Uncharacterized protein n=2 Tax=Klebsiella/Raoultella group TaxID=2890311 RepID=A0A285B818_9ENTR|nr:hypothetical protein KOSB73_300068 [Klebsiella grimontii]
MLVKEAGEADSKPQK